MTNDIEPGTVFILNNTRYWYNRKLDGSLVIVLSTTKKFSYPIKYHWNVYIFKSKKIESIGMDSSVGEILKI